MFKALLLGCGNIGALYDLHSNEVLTHAKAYAMHPDFDLTVFDINKDLKVQIANKYNASTLSELSEDSIGGFDCISICTPTNTHFELLRRIMNHHIKVIVCEKPVSNKQAEISELENLYKQHHSKILVNYIRRFQPDYINLEKKISELLKTEKLTNISIRYQRGFINNCSHALDLLQFLIGKEIEMKQISVTNLVFDQFENDPTISMNCYWENINVSILGLSNVKFSLFEIELYFEFTRISILDAGRIISVFHASKSDQFLQPLKRDEAFNQENCLKNYMTSVIDNAFQLLNNSQTNDNFLSASQLNLQMLKVINN